MSRIFDEWSLLEDPGILFLAMRTHINKKLRRDDLQAAVLPGSGVTEAFENALAHDEASSAVGQLCRLGAAQWTNLTTTNGRRSNAGLFLRMMQAIDDAFLAIHPRTAIAPVSLGGVPLAAWLIALRNRRQEEGDYARAAGERLIARGPFGRGARAPCDLATFSLRDQFAAISVARDTLMEDGRTLSLSIKVIAQGIARGVGPTRSKIGSETISLAPLAEADDDLTRNVRLDQGTHYIDIMKGGSFAPADRLARLIGECGQADILMMPELVFDAGDADALRQALATASGDRPRLVVGGSRLVDNGDFPPWNASEVLNAAGTPLWEHRKVSAYGMPSETFDNLKIEGIEEAERLEEQISWSEEVTIADIDGLGRCLVLICQDLMMDVVEQILRDYEPDWVLVPILDSGTNFKRWPFRRILDLSAIGPARFAVVSSLTMLHWRKTIFPGEQIGVAVGPRTIFRASKREDKEAAAQEINCESAERRHGSVQWRLGDWRTVNKASVGE